MVLCTNPLVLTLLNKMGSLNENKHILLRLLTPFSCLLVS